MGQSDSEAAESNARVGRWGLRIFWCFMLAETACAVAALVFQPDWLFPFAWAGWSISLLGLIAALLLVCRPAWPGRTWRASAMVMVVSVLGFGGLTALNIAAFSGRMREVLDRTASAGCLTAFSNRIHLYGEHYGHYPASLEALVDFGTYNDFLLAPADRNAPEAAFKDGRLVYCSYTYLPGQGPLVSDAAIVLVHERGPFRVDTFGGTGGSYRNVLYGDGHVTSLTEEEFQAALAKDRERRIELGWSPPLPSTAG